VKFGFRISAAVSLSVSLCWIFWNKGKILFQVQKSCFQHPCMDPRQIWKMPFFAVTIQISANIYICKHCIAFEHTSPNKTGYCLRGFSLTRNTFQVQIVMQKYKFENKLKNRLNLPFEQQLLCQQYLLPWIWVGRTKRIYVEIRQGCCNFDVEDRFSIQFKEGLWRPFFHPIQGRIGRKFLEDY